MVNGERRDKFNIFRHNGASHVTWPKGRAAKKGGKYFLRFIAANLLCRTVLRYLSNKQYSVINRYTEFKEIWVILEHYRSDYIICKLISTIMSQKCQRNGQIVGAEITSSISSLVRLVMFTSS